MNIRKILLPTDFSPASRAAIDPARTMAKKFGAQLDVLYVCDEPSILTGNDVVITQGQTLTVADLMMREARRQMESFVTEVRTEGITVGGRVVTGGAWQTIIDVIERERYDLAIVATHGRRGMDRFLVGSVTDKVVRHSPCPVLVIHPTKIA